VSSVPFDPVAYASGEIGPLLAQLARLTESIDPEQHAYFSHLCRHIDEATLPEHILEAFMNLSTAAFVGFTYSPEVALLLDQVLERCQGLSEALSLDLNDKH